MPRPRKRGARGRRLPSVVWSDEWDRLIAAATCLRDRAILALMLHTGLRASEVVGLRRVDVSLERGKLRTVGKGDKERRIDLHPKVMEFLERYLGAEDPERRPEALPGHEDAVFLSGQRRRLCVRQLHRIVREAGDRVGLHPDPERPEKSIHPHTLRHSFGTRVYEKTGDLVLTMRLMGHEDPSTTTIYTHLADPAAREAILKL